MALARDKEKILQTRGNDLAREGELLRDGGEAEQMQPNPAWVGESDVGEPPRRALTRALCRNIKATQDIRRDLGVKLRTRTL